LSDAHRADPEFGCRFLLDEARVAGELMAERTAWRSCSDLGWWAAFGKKRGNHGKKSGPPVHHDLCAVVDDKGRVRHQFTATARTSCGRPTSPSIESRRASCMAAGGRPCIAETIETTSLSDISRTVARRATI
jgi:hypothetical protein